MGKLNSTGADLARTLSSGSFTEAGAGTAKQFQGDFNVTISGTFTGTIRPIRSFDGGVTWHPWSYVDGSALEWTAPISTPFSETEPGVLFALEARAGFTGTADWRVSQ